MQLMDQDRQWLCIPSKGSVGIGEVGNLSKYSGTAILNCWKAESREPGHHQGDNIFVFTDERPLEICPTKVLLAYTDNPVNIGICKMEDVLYISNEWIPTYTELEILYEAPVRFNGKQIDCYGVLMGNPRQFLWVEKPICITPEQTSPDPDNTPDKAAEQ